MNDLTLIIPAKHESESLPTVLDELKKYSYKTNIILHHTDVETIKALKNYNIEIIYQKNFGYGDALIQGIKSCKTKYFCIFNADGSFNPSEIKDMCNSLQSRKLDFIFASRYQEKSGSEDDTIITFIGNYIFTYIGKIFFKLKITDILYTFVVGKTKEALMLDLVKKDFSFCIELPIKASKMKMKLGSIGSYERKRIAGKKKVSPFRDGFLILTHMARLFFR
jgi:glycosyltransferase involved in cell wall biosynthesis|tara:strand:- start:17014 stop:17679 length:666 start_codon:yes stop_codon:yes gene_type:complete